MAWKKFEEFLEGCLVHDHLLYLSGMREAFMKVRVQRSGIDTIK